MRKRPQQERSQQMVTTLIDATALCISKYGLDAVTTPKIAEMAGVSVGSLYQYFDDKQALIEALIEKGTHEVVKALQNLITQIESDSLEEIVRQSIQYGFSLLRQSDGLYLEIVKNWHRLPMQKMVDVMQSFSLDFGRLFFTKHYQTHSIQNLHVKFFIIVNSTLFTMMQYMSGQNSMISQDEITNELTDMIVRYLQQEDAKSLVV
ncbi:MAG: TetR/AcrR family transcriptional regulator [Aquirhabdus sp.]